MVSDDPRTARVEPRGSGRSQLRIVALRVVTVLKRPLSRGLLRRLAASAPASVVRMRVGSMSEARVLEVVTRLEAAGVRVWVAGGWGIDALIGRRTRRHGDLDVIVDRADEERVIATLAGLGYSRLTAWPSPSPLVPKRFVAYDALGRAVDVNAVDLPVWLATVVAARLPEAHDPAKAAFAEGRIGGRRVPCTSPALQRAAHEGYDRRDTDEHDLDRLERARQRAAPGEPGSG